MKLILTKAVPNLGDEGDVVSVKPGYGRNYLIPHGLAYVASDANLQRMEEEQIKRQEKARKEFLEARRRASQIEDVKLTFVERAGEDGKLFGSVTASDIADRLNTLELDFEVDKKWVLLEEPVKSTGAQGVLVRLHQDVIVEIGVEVEPEEG